MDPIAPPDVTEELRVAVEAASDHDKLRVMIRFRNYPDWDIPVLPDPSILSDANVRETMNARNKALDERDALLDQLIATHLSNRAIGPIVMGARFSGSGWVVAELPKRSLLHLLEDPAFLSIRLAERGGIEEQWSLGGARPGARLDVSQFHDAGVDGWTSNSGRHSYGRLAAGVVELWSLEDDSCGWLDGAGSASCTGSTSRVITKFSCTDYNNDNDICEAWSGLPAEESTEANSGGHGTAVTSIILADFQDDQACLVAMGDLAWNGTCHDSIWELDASGIAPEAKLIFAGELDPSQGQTAWAAAIVELRNAHVDAANFSIFESSEPTCRIDAVTLVEEEMENLFDDGALIAAGAGNNNGGGIGGACNANAPASLVKTLAVNGYDSDVAACETSMSSCKLKGNASSNGGADATIDGVVRGGAVTMIDLVAPTDIAYHTRPWGSYGEVEEEPTKIFGGTSAATPVISGLGLLVKHWYLNRGVTSINNPGRLHTVMLAMGDRHYSTNPANSAVATTQRVTGGDRNYGFGRAKLRLIGSGRPGGPWGDDLTSKTFTAGSTTTQTYFPFSTPLPSGVNLIKCVLFQVEDMSGSKDDISDIDLKVWVKAKVGSSCSTSGSFVTSGYDSSRDTKSMVAIDSSNSTLSGTCVQVDVIPYHVSTAGITTQLACYYSGINDDVTAYP